MDNGICGFNMIPEYNTSSRFMEGVNLSDTVKMEGINTIYLNLITEVVKHLRTDIHEIPMFYSFFNYLYIRKVLPCP